MFNDISVFVTDTTLVFQNTWFEISVSPLFVGIRPVFDAIISLFKVIKPFFRRS
jgi:hypothetical protein